MASVDKQSFMALRNEVIMAEALNTKVIKPKVQEAIHRYTGRFIPPIGTDWDVILNEIYPVIQFNLPSIFFKNPKVFLKPRNKTFLKKERNAVSGKMEEVQADSTKSARTQEHLLNYTLTEIRYKQEIRKILLDALLFPHGVLWHGYKGDFGMTEERSLFIKSERVFVKRISPLRFIKDPSVSFNEMSEGKWVGRIIDIPRQDLIEDKKFDVDKEIVKGFKGFGTILKESRNGQDAESINQAPKQLLNYTSPEFQNSPKSKFVRIYEIYQRATKAQEREGKPGKIIVFTKEQEKPLRVDDWNIKAEGFPAKLLEFNAVPDEMCGLADIDTYKIIADQKNAIVNLQLRNAQENSKVYVGLSKEAAIEEDIDMVRNGDQTIIRFEEGNPRDRMFVASAGGQASSELYLIDGRIQKNLEDKSGVSDLKRGFLQSGEESATSVKIRNAGSAARPQYRQDIMSDFLADSALYISELLKQYLPFTQAVRIIGTLDIEWSENPSKESIQADVDVEIDVQSMLPENPERELQELQQVLGMMIQGLTEPAIIAKLQRENKTINLAPIIEQLLFRLKIRDPEIFRNIRPEESMGMV